MALPTASQVIGVANTLLQHAGVRRSVHGIEQCGSVLFLQLYEALTGTRPPATGGESEAERCQAVVDAFSEQLSPHISLDHITGRDLAAREPLTIINLLDIFSVLFHIPSVKKQSSQVADNDRDNPPTNEGHNVSEDELGSTHCHTHLSSSYSTESTAELLRSVPPSHRPNHPPSLTITSLTCSTIDQSQSSEIMGVTPNNIPSTGGPIGLPPCTPPPSHIQAPLHHSTPRQEPTKSRFLPGHNAVSFPLTRVTMTTATPLMTSSLHRLPSATSDTSSTTASEEAGDGTDNTTLDIPIPTTVPDSNSTLLESEHENGTNASKTSTESPSPQKTESQSVILQPPSSPKSCQREEGEMEVVRRKILSSLYQRYLEELKTCQVSPVTQNKKKKSTIVSSIQYKPHGRKTVTKPPQRLLRCRNDHRGLRKKDDRKTQGHSQTSQDVGVTSDLFPVVESYLPVCPVATETVRHLWKKQLQQITTLTKPTHHHHHHTPSTTSEIDEVKRKHTALLEAIKKEIEHTRRMRGQEEARAQQRAVKYQLQARRQATARARRYFRDYELNLKSKLQKKRTNEEQVFRRVFEDGLALLRERERELQRFAKEKQQSQRERQRQQLEAMEQYYNDQFSMLAESLARQRGSAAVRDKAQNKLSETLCHELRERLEKEVKEVQECLDRDDDVTHFRELDAQQLRLALHHMFTPSL